MDKNELKDFINKQKWIFARTYAPSAPHEYIVQWKHEGTNEEFEAAMDYIDTHGMRMFFYSHPYTYLFVDGLFYWTMRSSKPNTPSIINRCKPEDYDIVFMKKGTK